MADRRHTAVLRIVLLVLLPASTLPSFLNTNKVDVRVYYETHCPDSVAFITRQLYPVWKQLGDHMNIKFIPFGKSQSGLYGNFQCQHGPKECQGNRIQSCVLHGLPEGSPAQVEFVNCIMSSRDPLESAQQCTESTGLPWSMVAQCVMSDMGRDLQLEMERLTREIAPEPTFVPTITFGNVFRTRDTRESQYNFKGTVCRNIPSPKPSVC